MLLLKTGRSVYNLRYSRSAFVFRKNTFSDLPYITKVVFGYIALLCVGTRTIEDRRKLKKRLRAVVDMLLNYLFVSL
jgi:hypothetical protein